MESRKRRTRRSRSFMREQEEYSDISIPITREREDKPVRKAKKKGAMNRVAGSTNSTKESPIPPSKTTRKMASRISTVGRELYLKKRKAFMHCSLSSLLKILKASTI